MSGGHLALYESPARSRTHQLESEHPASPVPAGRTSPPSAATSISAPASGIQARDHLRTLTDADDIAEWAIEPAPIRDRRFDTFLRAIARRTCIELGLPTPDWATPERLESEWVMTNLTSRYARTKRNTPTDLAALNIFVTENDLATA